MAKENALNFMRFAANNQEVAAKLGPSQKGGDLKQVVQQHVIPVAKSYGYDFTADEFVASVQDAQSQNQPQALGEGASFFDIVGLIGSIVTLFGPPISPRPHTKRYSKK